MEKTPKGMNRSMENSVELSLRDGLVRCSGDLHILFVDHHFLGFSDLGQHFIENFVEEIFNNSFGPLDRDNTSEHDDTLVHVGKVEYLVVVSAF